MKKKIIVAIGLIASLMACKKQIAIDLPITKLATGSVFNNDVTATQAQLAVYAQINGFPYNLHWVTALSSDELSSSAGDQNSVDIYTNALVAADGSSGSILQFWSLYIYIYQVNAILENLQISTGLSPKVKQQLAGESEFIRAYLYFYMVNAFGDVPLVTTTNYKVNTTMRRTSKDSVYQQIVKDLIAAEKDLSPQYVDVSDTVTTVDRVRPTVWAADALLARTYLYMGNGFYDKAEGQATAVIDNTAQFSLPADLNAVFKKNSTEAIWQTASYISGGSLDVDYARDATSFVLTAPPTAYANNSSTISPQLLNAFEPGDQRMSSWIGIYTNGVNSWKYPAKYKDIPATTPSTSEYTMVLRLAEQYLIRAEARAQQGNITGANGALADLNTIRHRAGLGDYSGAMDQASVITAISHERQVELFVEGDRWFNLKRTGTIDAVMTIVTPQKGGSNWQSYQQLYPIWPLDLTNNANLVQNPGY